MRVVFHELFFHELFFHELVVHAPAKRSLCAGTVIGSGTVANENYRELGSSCISEWCGIEMVDHGESRTPCVSFDDTVFMEARMPDEGALFGAIEQHVCKLK